MLVQAHIKENIEESQLPALCEYNGAANNAQSIATVSIIIFVFPSPRPLPCINNLFIQGRGRGGGNTKIIVKTVASDCATMAGFRAMT